MLTLLGSWLFVWPLLFRLLIDGTPLTVASRAPEVAPAGTVICRWVQACTLVTVPAETPLIVIAVAAASKLKPWMSMVSPRRTG